MITFVSLLKVPNFTLSVRIWHPRIGEGRDIGNMASRMAGCYGKYSPCDLGIYVNGEITSWERFVPVVRHEMGHVALDLIGHHYGGRPADAPEEGDANILAACLSAWEVGIEEMALAARRLPDGILFGRRPAGLMSNGARILARARRQPRE